jgi:aminoglycoside phosphotransferase family enzyme
MATLEQKVAFLSSAASYGDAVGRVDAIETHMAWVFLTETEVFKLKKPVRYSFLDFSSPEKRRAICEEELRLNRRLARGTYEKVLALRQETGGRLSLQGTGRVVDCLVVMKRLPDEASLEHRIATHRFGRDEAARLGATLGRFYASLPQEAGSDYRLHLEEEHALNCELLRDPRFGLSPADLEPLARFGTALQTMRAEFDDRLRHGPIVEGHGDLRPEHVFLVEPIQIIDCLEFNRSMRILDPYDEVGYLGLECELLGAGWVRQVLLNALEKTLGTPPTPELLAFYGTFRALLRARLCLAHLLETPVRHADKWRPLAKLCLGIAERESLSLPSRGSPKELRPFPGA